MSEKAEVCVPVVMVKEKEEEDIALSSIPMGNPKPRVESPTEGVENAEEEEEMEPVRTRTCCGVTRNSAGEWQVTHMVKLALGLFAIVTILLALAFLFADVGLHRVTVSSVTSNGHATSNIVAGIFAGFACLLSFHQIWHHKRHWTHGPSQKYIVRVLLMVPVYAVTAFLGLVFLDASSYFDFVRTVYEAFTIYCFLMLLTKFVGGHDGVCVAMRKEGPTTHWPRPLSLCCRDAEIVINPDFVWWLKRGTLQYSIIAPLCALVAICATKANMYKEGKFAADNVYIYVIIVINCSQMLALYCLVWLYHAIHTSIAPFSPLAKFLSVKAVVFASFWQGIIIAALVHFRVIRDGTQFDAGQIQVGLQDLIITMEMFIAALAHYYIFPVAPYADGSIHKLLDEAKITSGRQEETTATHVTTSDSVTATRTGIAIVVLVEPAETEMRRMTGPSTVKVHFDLDASHEQSIE